MATKRASPPQTSVGQERSEASLDSLFIDHNPPSEPDTADIERAALAIRPTPSTGDPFDPVESLGGGEQARLEYVAPDGTSHTRILLDTTTIGRHTDNDIQLLDPEVSKAHLVVRRAKNGFVIEDLGSANGTLVNGVRQTRSKLNDNDVIVVGNSVLRFRVETLSPKRPPTTGRRLASIQEARRSDPSMSFRTFSTTPRGRDEDSFEHTSVTIVPDISNEQESVFAQPMEPDFRPEGAVRDERQLRRDYERLRVAYDISNAIGLETDLGALGERMVEGIRDVLPADTIVVMLRDPALKEKEGGELVTLASFADRGNEVRIPRAIIERVVSTGRGLLTSDAQRDVNLRRSETVVGQQIRSALCVPLVMSGEVLGVIHLSSSSAAGAYEEKDLALLRAIAQPAALAVANARLVRKAEEDAAQRAELSRFLSPALVEKVVNSELNVAKQGDKVQATVLFSDIRGFTGLTEGKAPEAVVSMLNEYFEAMVEIVFDFGGTLDKFIGDGLMAVWGTPVPGPDDPMLAVRAAARMRLLLDSVVNAARTKRGEGKLEAGYGIATGKVIAGAMGARRRQDFTVIGDTVNLSSRLCGQARPGQILVDENTERICRRAGIPLQALEARVVKGYARPVPVWQVPREGTADRGADGGGHG